VILEAHGLRLKLPKGWSGRIFSRTRGLATLHAGDFRLALDDGEFGDASTGAMPSVGAFLALTEYREGAGLTPGEGLFGSRRIPRPLDPTAFSSSRLAHPRRGQVGTQHFFTASGRPLCLYVVLAGGGGGRRRQLAAVDHVLSSLRIVPRA
jgi:hypothetical protein